MTTGLNKTIIANNIQYYMDKTGKKRKELCMDLDIKYSTLSEWLQGKKYPRIDKIEKLADYFGVQKSDLIEEQHIFKTVFESGDDMVSYKVFFNIIAIDDQEKWLSNHYDRVSIPRSWLNGKAPEDFFVYTTNFGYEPIFQSGDIILFYKSNDLHDKDLCIGFFNNAKAEIRRIELQQDSDHEFSLKTSHIDSRAHSENQGYQYNTMEQENHKFVILGRAVKVIRTIAEIDATK